MKFRNSYEALIGDWSIELHLGVPPFLNGENLKKLLEIDVEIAEEEWMPFAKGDLRRLIEESPYDSMDLFFLGDVFYGERDRTMG